VHGSPVSWDIGTRKHLSVALTVACAILGTPSIAACKLPDERLPDTISSSGPKHNVHSRTWNIDDIIEVRWVTDVAISDLTHEVAFVVKQSFVDDGSIRYALYVEPNRSGAVAHKLVEASYISGLSWHPGTRRWSVLADFGDGVQLYDVDAAGGRHDLVISSSTGLVGAHEGLISSAADGPRRTGVLSYGWAPDGSALWYSRLRLQSTAARSADASKGIVYDDVTMTAHAFRRADRPLLGIDLRLFSPEARTDQQIAYWPAVGASDQMAFVHNTTIWWLADSRHIRYTLVPMSKSGAQDYTEIDAEVADGRVVGSRTILSNGGPFGKLPVGADGDYLIVKPVGQTRHLIRENAQGKPVREYGVVGYEGFGFGVPLWADSTGQRVVLNVRYRDHDGLVVVPAGRATTQLQEITDNLDHCAFPSDLHGRGACVRESINGPPELVSVSPDSGIVEPLARPNAERYGEITPLRSVAHTWINKYGDANNGFITYPRNYVKGRTYPTLVVTHAKDARNRFAYDGFQWEFPVQFFAEQGYLVLSVNDPWITDKTRAAADAFRTGRPKVAVDKQQFEEAFDAVASMVAALRYAIDEGIADSTATGICGYSRGAEMVEYVMTQTKAFKAASEGDAGGWDDNLYWSYGTRQYKALYKVMYGGSPIDSAALQYYRRLSPSFRASQFAGPLLQQFAGATAQWALELHTYLEDANIPTELAYYPNESHIFWQPQHRASAMRRNVEWFDYWLRHRRDPNPVDPAQYERWDEMARAWHSSTSARH
jgi:dipeptidyl aminopeptidase/acylaminoacyl peptidase